MFGDHGRQGGIPGQGRGGHDDAVGGGPGGCRGSRVLSGCYASREATIREVWVPGQVGLAVL